MVQGLGFGICQSNWPKSKLAGHKKLALIELALIELAKVGHWPNSKKTWRGRSRTGLNRASSSSQCGTSGLPGLTANPLDTRSLLQCAADAAPRSVGARGFPGSEAAIPQEPT